MSAKLHAKSPEQELIDAQQRAADELACCAIEHAARLKDDPGNPDKRKVLIAQAAALLAYAYVDFCERYGHVPQEQLRDAVTKGVQMYAPVLAPGGKG